MSFLEHFIDLSDPRKNNPNKQYSVALIVFITISAVISGANDWQEVAAFGSAKKGWIKKFVSLPDDDRTPSHDTIGDFFARIKSEEFISCFIAWVSSLTGVLSMDLIAIDGKTLRSSYDQASGKKAIHMINAWSSNMRLCLANLPVDDKTNEIKAIPDLLSLLELEGALITIDAMGCQREIAKQIVEQKADYVFSVKGNQENLLRDITDSFKSSRDRETASTLDKDHGRIEHRTCSVMEDLRDIIQKDEWKNLKTIIKMERKRTVMNTNKTSHEVLYYISSRSLSAQQALDTIRGHWAIENQLHYVLDVQFFEDFSRIRTGEADINMATIRKIALNMIKLNHDKGSLNIKRHKAAWDDEFRQRIMKI